MLWFWIKNVSRDVNFIPSLFLIMVALFALLGALRMGIGSLNSPGPGLMFFGAACILGILSLHLFAKSLIARSKERPILLEGSHWDRVIITLIAISAYTYILVPAGYLLSTFALLSLLFNIFPREKKGIMVIAAAGVAFLTYMIFFKILGVQLPRGLINF